MAIMTECKNWNYQAIKASKRYEKFSKPSGYPNRAKGRVTIRDFNDCSATTHARQEKRFTSNGLKYSCRNSTTFVTLAHGEEPDGQELDRMMKSGGTTTSNATSTPALRSADAASSRLRKHSNTSKGAKSLKAPQNPRAEVKTANGVREVAECDASLSTYGTKITRCRQTTWKCSTSPPWTVHEGRLITTVNSAT